MIGKLNLSLKAQQLNKLGFVLLALISISFVGCQRIQNASAQQSAYANNQEPVANAEKIEEPVKKEVAETPPPVKKSRNEFGFSNDAPTPPKPDYRDNKPIKKPVTEVRKRISRIEPPSLNTSIDAPKIPAPPIPPAPTFTEAPPAPKPQSQLKNPIVRLGAANLVPGDNLHVTLPGEFANLGPISIERLDSSGNTLGSPWASGTQMQIPNPNLAGGKIYFKVP